MKKIPEWIYYFSTFLKIPNLLFRSRKMHSFFGRKKDHMVSNNSEGNLFLKILRSFKYDGTLYVSFKNQAGEKLILA